MRIDLNADLGESFGRWRLGDDEAMLDIVTSANVACGFHAGDALTLRRTCEWAAERGVVVGAQVSYRDLAGFGRRFIDMAPDELTADVLYQLGALDAMCRAAGTSVRYVKPHGALYHAVTSDEDQAQAVIAAIVAFDPTLSVMGLPHAASLRLAAAAGLPTVVEAFADRGYNADGMLVPRDQPGALVVDPARVADRVVRLVTTGRIDTVTGGDREVRADSVCIHGDSPGAVVTAVAVRDALVAAGIDVAPFVAS